MVVAGLLPGSNPMGWYAGGGGGVWTLNTKNGGPGGGGGGIMLVEVPDNPVMVMELTAGLLHW